MTTLQSLIDAAQQGNIDPTTLEICTYINDDEADAAALTDVDFRHEELIGGKTGRPIVVLVTTGEYMPLVEVLDDGEPESPEERAYWEQQAKLCHATYVTGPSHDPYGTECDLEKHGVDVKHEGPDPLGGPGRVRWHGGGSIEGDPLPTRDVEWVDVCANGHTLSPETLTAGGTCAQCEQPRVMTDDINTHNGQY